MSAGRVMRVYLDADLRCGHDGLAGMARKDKMDVQTLEPGQYLVFINSRKDKMKVYASSGVLAYLRLDKGRSIDLQTIRAIPQAFQGNGRIDYDAALKKTVLASLARPRKLDREVMHS